MISAASSLVFGLALMGGLWPFGGDGQPSREATIDSLESQTLELKPAPTIQDASQLARDQYRLFLEVSKDNPELQREAMRRLGDLNLAAGEAEQYDGAISQDSGFYAEAVKLYTLLLESNPDYGDADRILYQLARAYETTGETDQALATLNRLITEYPDSHFFDEAHFRRGEIFFFDKQFSSAESAYTAVIATGSSSAFYEQALYKRGWSLFKQSELEESMDSFMALLDRRLAGVTERGGSDVLEKMSRPERELVDDTFRVMSITFSYLDGYQSIDNLLEQRNRTDYADLLYMNLGDLYLDKERYIDAAKTYDAFVAHNPVHVQSPKLQVRVVEAYTLAEFPSLVLESKRDYVARYGLDSAFWVGRSAGDWPEVVGHLKENLTDLAAYDHAKAQEDGDAEAYERAARLYRRYLEFFPEDPDSAQRNFLLAEILFELQRFDEATEEYLHTAYNFGRHEKAAKAGYAALVSARKFEEGLSGEEQQVWRTATISNALQFADVFPEHEQAAAVLTTVAEELYGDGERERAVQVAGLVITLQPPAEMELERTAWTVIAHAKFDMQQYAEAEQAYFRLQGMPIVDDATRAQIGERIAASVYRQAEEAQAAGEIGAAVDQFMRVAAVQPGSEFAPTAVYDAAALLITNQQWLEAADILEHFRREFPDHRFNDDVTQKLAVAHEEAGETVRAGIEYERIATLAGVDAGVHREALWRAADLYEKAGTATDRQRVYAEIVTRFPAPFGESIEARQRLADLAKESGNWSERRNWLESIVKADATSGAARTDRSRTLAATASLELAGPVRDAFLAVRLTNPLKESLLLKKERMELALAAYGTAADYGVAEVTTAATFEIADLYYRLGNDLMDSERPASLSAEELEQYDILLEEQAFPFEEQAIEIFIANTNRAADGIYDQWVRKSFSRLAELMPARYAKSERSETLVAQLD